MKTGLVLLISANTGMGSGRAAATSISALPPFRDPVNPTAFTSGCLTSAMPTLLPESNKSEKTPSGKPHSRTLSSNSWPTSSLVPGCAGCAFTITGLPAASAEAVSPPATEKASGKLLAPKIATGPKRMKHRPQIRFRSRFAIGIGPVDSGHDPRTLFHHFREQAKLAGGARRFAYEARLWQSTLQLGSLNQRIHGAVNLGRDGAQKLPSFHGLRIRP